jgi:hypothetical protein
MTARRAGAGAVAAIVTMTVAGAAAAFADPDDRLAAALVFAACVAPVGWALGWALLVAPVEDPPSPHAEDDVERVWMQRATSAAFLDMLIVLGLALTVVSVVGTGDASPQLVLTLVLGGAMLDAAVRYLAGSRLAR